MTSDAGSVSPSSDPTLRAAAATIRREADAVAQLAARRLHDQVPEASIDPLTFEETRRTSRATLLAMLDTWRRGAPLDAVEPPHALTFQVGIMAREGIGLDVLLRILQLGHATFAEVWDEHILAVDTTPERRLRAMRLAHQLTFGWFGGLTDRLSVLYAAERERTARLPEAERRAAVQAALSGRPSDPDALSRAAGYEFRRPHVGLVLWQPDPVTEGVPAAAGGEEAVRAAAAAIAAALGAGPPLVVFTASAVAWAWIGLRAPHDVEGVVTAVRATTEATHPPVVVAVGEPAAGLDGFRRTHEQALAAYRVAAGGGQGAVVPFADVELVALLTADPAAARRFVARRLGDLAAPGPRTALLREALQVHLAEFRARHPTAVRLGVHPNTATARARAAEALLPQSALDAPVEVQAALVLADALGPSG